MPYLIVWVLVCGCLAGCGTGNMPAAATSPPHAFSPDVEKAAAAIDSAQLRKWIAALADDSFEGRAPATEGDRRARAYLVSELRAMGYEPGANGALGESAKGAFGESANGAFEQGVELVGITPDVPKTWTFAGRAGSLTLNERDDFIAKSGVQTPVASLKDAEVVFVGYGIEAPEYQWDDFKGVDVAGKVLLMLNNDPDWDPALFEGSRRLYYGRWTYKYESAARHGAAGAIIIHTTPSAAYRWQVVTTSNVGTEFELPAGDEPRIAISAWVTESSAKSLVALAGLDLDELIATARTRDFVPVPLGVTTSLALENTIERKQTANVVALLRGGDLAHEAVVFTAHHDHFGVGEPDESGDTIYNGALDNAVGVATVLGIAKGFTQLEIRPRRSIVVCLVAAEEQGLLGSAYYATHPTFPLRNIAANVNFDGGNVWGRSRDVTFVGFGKSNLDAVANEVAAHQRRTVKGDPFPEQGTFYRSDQFSLARVGIPAMYLRTGIDVIDKPQGWGREQMDRFTAERYHQPNDEYDPAWNLDGLAEDARFAFFAGYIVANGPMPRWNAGDEFEAARLATFATHATEP